MKRKGNNIMHFFADVEKVIPQNVERVESQKVEGNIVTHEDLETLANAFKESVAESIKANNEKLKMEMVDFLKHNNIASNILEADEETDDTGTNEEKEGE